MVAIRLELETRVGNRRKSFKDASKGLEAFSQGAISFENMGPIWRREMLKFLKAIAAAQGTRHGRPWPGGTGKTTLSRRTGDLMASVKKSVRTTGRFTDTGGEITGRIGSPLIYASTQELGATIRPKKAQYLTVPLPAALDARGVMKLPKARDYPNTFVQRSRRGNLIIFQKKGRGIVPLFVLKKQVKIPPRMNLGVMIEAGSRALGDRVIAETLRDFQAGKI